MIEINCIIPDEMLPGLKDFLGDVYLNIKELKICSVDGCTDGYYAKGYCQKHYKKWRNYGDPLYKQVTVNESTKHERKEWNRIKSICSDSGHGLYPRYGGAGVTVCERWGEFTAFYEDMGDRPSSGAIVDCSGVVFNKDNCRWITLEEFQENNMKIASERFRNE